MKTKKGIIVLLACFALIGITGFSYAAIVNSTDTTKNVSTSNLDIELVQTSNDDKKVVDGDEGLGFDFGEVLPGTVIDESVAVQTSDSSKAAYVRVTVNRYWAKDGVKSEKLDPTTIKLNSKNENWKMVVDHDDSEVVYFYYLLPLESGTLSSNLMDSFEVFNDGNVNSNEYSGYESHLDFFAEGVQVLAGKDAILAEWGVNATINENNEITNIVEQ